MSSTANKKQNLKALRKRRAKRRFAFLAQLRRDTTLSSSAKMVVWSLADDFYNLDDEQCNAGFTSLGKAIGRSRRPTIVAITEAKDAGWITISSIGGGSKRSTNRYTLVWDKVANSTASEKPSAQFELPSGETIQPIDDTKQTVPAADAGQLAEDTPGDGHYTDIKENEVEGCCTRHQCCETSLGVLYTAHEPPPNLEEGGGREGKPGAACGFAAPLKREEEELAFQQLCQLWQVREHFWPAIDEVKAREAFAAVYAEYGDQIHGVDTGYYLVEQAKVWIAGGDGPRFLKRLEVWLGAKPDKGDAVPWWSKHPTPKVSVGRGRKPDLLAITMGRRAS